MSQLGVAVGVKLVHMRGMSARPHGEEEMSHLKIYGIPMSRAFRALWMANELGVDYENVPIHFADGSSKTPEYLAINPNGKIPAIEDDGLKLWESMAINLYLAKKYDRGLWLNSPETEAQAIQWSVWVMAEVEKAALAVLLNRFFLPEDQRDPKGATDGEQQLQRPLKVLDEALAKTGYLIGSSFTAADLNVASVLSWAKIGRVDLSAYPNVDKWLTQALCRPAAVKASGRE
jgi:glutathione S-transferase